MKTLSSALQAHLDTGVTTLAYCWKVTRTDGTVYGFTEHDRDITALGTTFSAETGFTASQIEQGLGLSIDNLEATGALSSASLNDADILAGRFDDATVELYWINWQDPTQIVVIAQGNLGEIKRQGVAFSAEFRSLAHRLDQKIGQTYERSCSAALGDARCGIDLTLPTLQAPVAVSTATTSRDIVVSGLESFASDWFTGGTLTFSTGHDALIPFEIKSHRKTSGIDILELWLPPPFAIAAGDIGRAVAGCRKNFATCQSKFNNVTNFRGFPHIPGVDVVTRYGVQGALDQTGGSIFSDKR